MLLLIDPNILPKRGPASNYVVTDANGQTVKASIEFEFLGKPMRVRINILAKLSKYTFRALLVI